MKDTREARRDSTRRVALCSLIVRVGKATGVCVALPRTVAEAEMIVRKGGDQVERI